MNRPSIEQQVTFIYTRNLEESGYFYEQVLGLPLVLDQGSCRIYRVSSTAFLGCCQGDNAPDPPAGIIITLATSEVDGWYDYLREQGITFEKRPVHNSTYNIYHCFLRDPSGYLIEIQQFLDSTWPASDGVQGNQ